MGKASKWFRGLLGLKTPDSSSPKPPKEKRRWSFVKSYREKDNRLATAPVQGADKHALAELVVAAATAAMAEARLTGTAAGVSARQEWAALKIQAAFRGCLARKALRALKGLVKLQALVRGHLERKRTTEWVQRVQALLRAQARARVARAQILEQASYWSSAKSSSGPLYGPATPEKFESPISSESIKYGQSSSAHKRNISKSCAWINGNQDKCGARYDSRVDEQSWTQPRSCMRTCSMDDERSFRILDVDSGKPHIRSKRRNLFYSASQALLPDHYSQSLTTTKDSTSYQTVQSQSSCEVLKMNEVEENSYQEVLSASSKDGGSKRSPLTTPTKSDGSRSYLSGYNADYYPSYMAYTESSKAKVRSLSAPKQRPPQYERSGSSKLATQRIATLRESFTSKAYPGSGRLDKLGLPIGYSY